ncbi:MAG: PrsW family intramembrane metalloprotease [Treponema sp.]|jgi:RsiW-degrading membrane proteinase PrsW (M82 family)|nr:PrsW family intramembrane metalloprotease [Treponema sp.]
MTGLGILVLLIFISSIPAIAVYCWFRLAKYPFSLFQFSAALLAGAAAFFPALVLQRIFPGDAVWAAGKWALLIKIFIQGALTEELSRLLVLLVLFGIIGRFRDGTKDTSGETGIMSYNTIIWGTAAGLAAGLGFAVLESAAYGASDANVVMLRAVTAAPLHAACGSRVGSAAILFRERPAQAVFRFLSAVVIHGIYNFMIIMPGFPSLAAVLIALSTLASSILAIRGGMRPVAEKM